MFVLQNNYGEPSLGVNQFNAHSGLNALDLTGQFNQGLESGVEQTIPTEAGAAYVVSFYVGRATGTAAAYGTPATVDLSIAGGPRVPFTNSNSTPGRIHWQPFSTAFVATGTTTVLRFYNGQTSNRYTGLDSVSVTLAPEPDVVNYSFVPGTGIEAGQTVINLTATSTPGLTYGLESSRDLQNWNVLQTLTSGPGGTISFRALESATLPRCFYRPRRQ
jgi:hypothetical protein